MRFPIFIPCLLIVLATQIPQKGWSQQRKELTPVNYQKIAFVDAVRLRNEYVAFAAAKEKMHKEASEKRRSFDEANRNLEQQTKEQLKKDSIHKLQQKQLINDKASVKRYELQTQYAADIKQRSADRAALAKTYEDKIKQAIHTIMREGAFTDMRYGKDSTGKTGTDVTDLVLQKLNQNQ